MQQPPQPCSILSIVTALLRQGDLNLGHTGLQAAFMLLFIGKKESVPLCSNPLHLD